MPRAERDLHEIFLYIRASSSPPAAKWFRGLVDAIATLTEHPLRSPKTAEDARLRHLLYGTRPHIYRVIYAVDTAKRQVEIVHIRHHAQNAFDPTDLRRSEP